MYMTCLDTRIAAAFFLLPSLLLLRPARR